jgi:hypothetical protein
MGAKRNRRSEVSDLHGACKSPGIAVRHAYPGRSSIEPTTILLREQKYRLIGIGPFMFRAIAGAPGHRS